MDSRPHLPDSPTTWPLAATELEAIAAAGTRRTLTRGEVVFEHGDPAASLYLVESGVVELVFEAGKPGKRLDTGTLFGELVLLRPDHRRTARAVAATDCSLLELGPAALDGLMASSPAVHVTLLKRACFSLLDSERGLIEELRRRNVELERTLDFLRRTREELDSTEIRALTDDLTGIYNRRCLTERIERLVERARSSGLHLALILVDLDHFKEVNDTHGHAVGDLVLRRLAEGLRSSVRWCDLPCRLGGDELAVVLTDLPNTTAARSRAAELFDSIGALQIAAGSCTVEVTTSIGGAVLGASEAWDELFARADAGLYLAKRNGRHCLAWEGQLTTFPELPVTAAEEGS